MGILHDVKSLKEATELRFEVENHLVELMEEQHRRIENRRGAPGVDVLADEIELQRHAVEATRSMQSFFVRRRQFWLTICVAGVAAVATAVYAATYLWTTMSGRCS
jgi:hypothetical protein